jgi:SAM-dependent methyltransferase
MPPEFDQYSQSYSQDIDKTIGVFGQRHDFFIQAKADVLLPVFATLRPDGAPPRVLDVGCGVGLLHRYIIHAVERLDGAEVSGASLDMARRNNPRAHYSVYDGGTLPYPDASFDCAFAIAVMHHVPRDQWPGFLREMRRVVRPGGQVLVIEHNPLNPATQWVVRHAPMDQNAELLTPWHLRRLMKAAGLSRPWLRYILFTPFAAGAFRMLDRMLGWLPLGTQYAMGGRV